MEQKKKFANQIAELQQLNKVCEAVLTSVEDLNMGIPPEREQCREGMRALRKMLGEMRILSLQVEMYIAEYSDLTAASNDDIK
ncbi:hypothetical protein MKD49_03530 [Herbaspirillum sp. WGmk3]|uniref:hypothetical protein n=1 Tax=Herbaspirillum sp. WGmk3 TaxID=2919925 RepID=UPI002091E0A4|nr:hypothetical protein [Herbaspirillum sp. WGmk3]MCO4855550.1 hypothetical protein [Herbaspirillum sp. WGmk3]